MLTPRTLLLACCLAAPCAADVLDVRGPSPDFNEIQPAVLAAADGDVVRVWPGSYGPFWIDDKALSVVNAGGGSVTVQGTVRVRNLAAWRAVLLSGIDAHGQDGRALIVSDCQGAVRVRDGEFRGAAGQVWWLYPDPGVLVWQCADVVLVDCEAHGGSPTIGEYGSPGATGLECWDAELALFGVRSVGSGGTTDDDPGASGYSGGHGVYATGQSRLWLAGCTLIGGGGGTGDPDPDPWTGYVGDGGDGGWGYYGPSSAWFQDNVYQPGVAGGSYGGWPGTNGQPHSPGVDRPGPARFVRAVPLATDGQALLVHCEGEPGEPVSLAFAPAPGHRFHPFRGPLLLAPRAVGDARPWRLEGVLDGAGQLTTIVALPDLPALDHGVLHLQGSFGAGPRFYGAPAWTAVLDGAW